jgi:hypothetical protein
MSDSGKMGQAASRRCQGAAPISRPAGAGACSVGVPADEEVDVTIDGPLFRLIQLTIVQDQPKRPPPMRTMKPRFMADTPRRTGERSGYER